MKTRLEREFLRMGAGGTWPGIRLVIGLAAREPRIPFWARLRMRLGLWILPKVKP